MYTNSLGFVEKKKCRETERFFGSTNAQVGTVLHNTMMMTVLAMNTPVRKLRQFEVVIHKLLPIISQVCSIRWEGW